MEHKVWVDVEPTDATIENRQSLDVIARFNDADGALSFAERLIEIGTAITGTSESVFCPKCASPNTRKHTEGAYIEMGSILGFEDEKCGDIDYEAFADTYICNSCGSLFWVDDPGDSGYSPEVHKCTV